ncbi:hypothetical protein EDB81DRAFT_950803 [Dactylonectria macrodidyma]|uniref:Heterokaryon incompatibility domain-containing protein n=1 Tax=Dactylonectria macrodidyma TaxID=307937 RepID=A0A9P9IS44_9HYPO|nr:hypothetical protein EDB81DRAFT_950803 [Dactylonectria macrodidyma]
MPTSGLPTSSRKRQRPGSSDNAASSLDDAVTDAGVVRDDSSLSSISDGPVFEVPPHHHEGSDRHHQTGPTVTISLGDQKHVIPQSEFLSHVWNGGLDSPCHACGRGFMQDTDPVVRTITFDTSEISQPNPLDFTSTPLAPHPIRIYNRHFSCIQAARIDYVPVSHAWHEHVSTAQSEHKPNSDVARLVYQTPVLSLLALTKKHDPTEIWHDYLSVRQWHRNVQRQLLLKIPVIYSYPQTMMIHLDDVRAIHLSNLITNSSYSDFKEGLLATTNSRWFERMWVTLEYIQGKDVAILSEDLVLCDYNARSHSSELDDAASKHVKRIGNTKFFKDMEVIGCKWKIKVSWSDMEVWKNRRDKHHTLGSAVYIMGSKKCQESADYYFALAGMIEYPLGHILPQDPFLSFLSLAMHALEHGDYSPLLFTPLPDEPVDNRAPWLRGYSAMSELLWDLGVCHSKANSLDIVKNGKLQPEVEPVGVIEAWDYMEFSEDAREFLYFITSRILKSSGTNPSEYCHALDRILTPLDRKALYTNWNKPSRSTRRGFDATCDLTRLEAKLDEFLIQEYTVEKSNPKVPTIMEEIDAILKLDRNEVNCKDNRKDITQAEAEWYNTKHGRPMEGVARIRCKFCGRRSIFRLTCWDVPTIDYSQVYRIPGLLYDETVTDGTGLVMSGDRIIGKMTYGTPACPCHRLERVAIGTHVETAQCVSG